MFFAEIGVNHEVCRDVWDEGLGFIHSVDTDRDCVRDATTYHDTLPPPHAVAGFST